MAFVQLEHDADESTAVGLQGVSHAWQQGMSDEQADASLMLGAVRFDE